MGRMSGQCRQVRRNRLCQGVQCEGKHRLHTRKAGGFWQEVCYVLSCCLYCAHPPTIKGAHRQSESGYQSQTLGPVSEWFQAPMSDLWHTASDRTCTKFQHVFLSARDHPANSGLAPMSSHGPGSEYPRLLLTTDGGGTREGSLTLSPPPFARLPVCLATCTGHPVW